MVKWKAQLPEYHLSGITNFMGDGGFGPGLWVRLTCLAIQGWKSESLKISNPTLSLYSKHLLFHTLKENIHLLS